MQGWAVLAMALAAAPFAGAQPFVEPEPLPPFPLLLKLLDGREIRVDELTRKDERVRFREATTGARRQVPADTVVSPPLGSIPVILTLSDGRELTVVGLHRAGDAIDQRLQQLVELDLLADEATDGEQYLRGVVRGSGHSGQRKRRVDRRQHVEASNCVHG